jgi:ubiquitin C-terminal hydrolase
MTGEYQSFQQTAQYLGELVSIEQQLSELQQNIDTCFNDQDHKQVEYRLHAVFMHRGQTNYGHYWVYIYDWVNNQWIKCDDETVMAVDEKEVFRNTPTEDENPSYLVYINVKEKDQLVRTANRGLKRARLGDA